ncbi:unnamed protein product [Rhizoctonia solani]|uniref:Fungal-type protein kinase domain-containing protein n=1 Tax=Rhizoctonia solani TaxID=456999 RepID=A0A8H2XXR2_9AGAM|nr:unnamed protein product [Rhizoctonia solani]
MSTSYPPSSPIELSCPPEDTRKAAAAYQDIKNLKLLQGVANQPFVDKYLPGCSLGFPPWTPQQNTFVQRIIQIKSGQEKFLYTGDVPLLCLLNDLSKSAFERSPTKQKAVVFLPGDNHRIVNPFTTQDRRPDVIAVWVKADDMDFSQIDYSEKGRKFKWCELAAVGEAKVEKEGQYQLASYLRNYLQLHPELNATLGLLTDSAGYVLLYHDAVAMHRSRFSWTQPGPLYEFVRNLYSQPFRDISMQILDPDRPAWATKVENDIYLSDSPRAQAGPGQRRYTSEAVNMRNDEVVHIKDIWRDERRLFFEPLLLEEAHKGENLAGLMTVHSYGYVTNNGNPIRTTHLNPESVGQASGRYKMRMMTKDIGRSLGEARSLRKFLCAMYDACAVQRNLYRKCRILHRDISDGNIMLAPDTDEYRKRCAKGYAHVKFVNQVLAKNKECEPNPECLVIDLGNGADLKIERDRDVLTERTASSTIYAGTPRFIARSVSTGDLLDPEVFNGGGVDLPPMTESLSDYREYMHTSEYDTLKSSGPATRSEVEFAHRLFHDAESTFWVIVWTLARSVKEGSEQETPHPIFCQFYHVIYRHFPDPGAMDTRLTLCLPSETYWRSVLHPDLAVLAPMLHQMFRYIQPDWAYRPELDPEHVHEALMRLLLKELVRMENHGGDITISIGGRATPPMPRHMTPLPLGTGSSVSEVSESASRSQTSNSVEPHHNSTSGAGSASAKSSKSGSKSRPAEPAAITYLLQKLELKPEQRLLEPCAKLKQQAEDLQWEEGAGQLKPTALGVSGNS